MENNEGIKDKCGEQDRDRREWGSIGTEDIWKQLGPDYRSPAPASPGEVSYWASSIVR